MYHRWARFALSLVGTLALVALTTAFVPVNSSHLTPNPVFGMFGSSSRTTSSASLPPVLGLHEGELMLRTARGPVALEELDLPSVPVSLLDTSTLFGRFIESEETTLPTPFFIPQPKEAESQELSWKTDSTLYTLSEDLMERTSRLLSGFSMATRVSQTLMKRASPYKNLVEKYASRYNLSPDLVFAVMYTESDFDPDLISHKSAHGLMQVVPETAGGEDLLHPETNIHYGTAYMYLLQSRYLSSITDPQSREYCAIAAYNIGARGMLRTFASSMDEAFSVINAMPPDEVRATLLRKLSSGETRAFLKQVLTSREHFSSLS